MNDTTQTQAARVTIDDVRNAIEGTDPNSTNASKVRSLLGGRGSFETIQKHLGILRAELAAAAMPPVAAGQVPAVPVDAAQAMWAAAWTAAQVATLARSDRLSSERDAALLKLDTMDKDLADQAAQLDQAAQALAKVQADHLADVARLEAAQAAESAQAAQVALELERTRQELTQERSASAHAAQIADAGRDLMRQEMARLNDQIGELKAALYNRAA